MPGRLPPELDTLAGTPPGPGFWSVTRHEDLRAVSRQPQVFSSANRFDISRPNAKAQVGHAPPTARRPQRHQTGRATFDW